MDDKIIVGTIGGSFGVQGEIRLKSFCADPAAIADYTPLTMDNGKIIEVLILTGQLKGGFSARAQGVSTKEEADALRGQSLHAARDLLPGLPDDEFYYTDLIGVSVVDTGGVLLGTVKTVVDNGAGDLLEIQLPNQPETVFLPFTKVNIPTVDLSAGRIVADPPHGIFAER